MLSGAVLPRRAGARLLSLVLSAALASACTSMRPVPPRAGGSDPSVRPGDEVLVTMRDGTAVQLTVTAVTADALVGEPPHGLLQRSRRVTVPFSDIAAIQRSEFSGRKTAGAGAALVAGAGVAFGIAVGVVAIWALTRIPAGTGGPANDALPESPRR